MRLLLITILLTFGIDSQSSEVKLLEFKTDYCTYFPEGTISSPNLCRDCCIGHDLWYWIGGTKSEQDQADIDLKTCVTKKSSSFYGNLMYSGVRLGHLSPIMSKYKWSWGWNNKNRHYQTVTNSEKDQAKQLLINLDDHQDLADIFIKEHLE